ncbi:hypothetical protein [Bradyrhizobium ottawaense]|uniref:Uncharacterized protein n=1 Tax=Bradyrhizobium ottawaense TaxID=931866 RepID=A0ABY0QHH1_9BRAD|nr:hypothetical protein [Bradyrhizobium ottawaense]SDK43910.1 hypothetical protein SAMN05444163_8114 [Bradyrhizobium ottawaense]
MVVFLLGSYALPFPLIKLNSFSYTHTHRAPDGFAWKEDMHLKVCVPGARPARLRIANDNQKVADHG